MMIVMLILSIIMAAFAPVVTTRSKSDRNSPWRYTSDNSNIYYGLGENQTAIIGQPNKVNGTDPSARLIINTSDDTQKHIVFKHGEKNVLGSLFMGEHTVILGNASKSGDYNTALGYDALLNNTGDYNVGIGYKADTAANKSVAIGSNAATGINGENAIAIGNNAKLNAENSINIGSTSSVSSANSIGIGKDIDLPSSISNLISLGNKSNVSSSGSIAIGYDSRALGFYSGWQADKNLGSSVAIGSNASAKGGVYQGSIAIGSNSYSGEGAVAIGGSGVVSAFNDTQALTKADSNSVAIGYNVEAALGSIAIGLSSYAKNAGSSVAIGSGSKIKALDNSYITDSVAIGCNASVAENYAAALGANAKVSAIRGTAIGTEASSSGNYSVALGYDADASGKSSIAIGSGALSYGENNIGIGKDACENVKGSNKICIGANSGPKSGDSWASDNTERVFIGGKSKFNNGSAVLEVHNEGASRWTGYGASNDSSVVINGNLVLKGALILPIIDRYGNNVSNLRMLQRRGEDEENASLRLQEKDFKSFVDTYYTSSRGGYNPYSDERLKYVGKENISGLDKIKKLKVYDYTFKKDDKKTPHVGVIAQDLQKIFPNAVKKGDDGYLKIRMEDMFYALVNAVKELDAKVTMLIKQENAKDKKIKALEDKNKELEIRLLRLEKKL